MSEEGDERVRLGRRLIAFRAREGIKQEELAKALGISPKHLSQVERGHQSLLSLKAGTLKRIADILHVSMDYLSERNTSEDNNDVTEATASALA